MCVARVCFLRECSRHMCTYAPRTSYLSYECRLQHLARRRRRFIYSRLHGRLRTPVRVCERANARIFASGAAAPVPMTVAHKCGKFGARSSGDCGVVVGGRGEGHTHAWGQLPTSPLLRIADSYCNMLRRCAATAAAAAGAAEAAAAAGISVYRASEFHIRPGIGQESFLPVSRHGACVCMCAHV